MDDDSHRSAVEPEGGHARAGDGDSRRTDGDNHRNDGAGRRTDDAGRRTDGGSHSDGAGRHSDGGTARADAAADTRDVRSDGLAARAVRLLVASAHEVRESRLATAGFAVLLVFVAVAVLAPHLAPYDPGALHVSDRLEGPSPEYPLGTDYLGRDMLSRVLFGARVALFVALAVPLAAASVGVPVGLAAGYAGGTLDDVLMRAMDAVFAFPAILLGLTIVAVFGQGLWNIVLALGIVFVPQFARVTRGSAMSATAERHVAAARAMGASHTRVVAVHVLPFCVSAILVQATVTAALAIILEASLSFLGVGVQSSTSLSFLGVSVQFSTPSWGLMLQEGKGYLETAPWYSLAPGVAIVLSVLGFNLLGDGLRDVLDPRSRTER